MILPKVCSAPCKVRNKRIYLTNMLRHKAISVLAALLCCLVPLPRAMAQADTIADAQPVADTVDRDADDFVTAYILFGQPAGVLYSRFGHVTLRMQCPTFGLDYIYTYEAEDAASRILRFFAGKLKMGLFAIPTEDYIAMYAAEHRGMKQYELDIPIYARRNLWRVLDGHLAEGVELPYDYLTHGCAYSARRFLREGLDTITIDYGTWPKKYDLTRRELTAMRLDDSPWCRAFLHLISNGSIDAPCTKYEKIIMPADLHELLMQAKVQGHPILKADCTELLPDGPGLKSPLVTPTMVAIALLLLTMVAAFMRWRFMDYVLLALQTLLGLVTVYLVCFSTLCCTEWSWLIIPFNPLPLICWKWRRHWALPYAIVIALWLMAMMLWPHTLTDTAYLILSAALVADYVNIFVRNGNFKITKYENKFT